MALETEKWEELAAGSPQGNGVGPPSWGLTGKEQVENYMKSRRLKTRKERQWGHHQGEEWEGRVGRSLGKEIFPIIPRSQGGRKALGEDLLTRSPERWAGGDGCWAVGKARFLYHVGSWDKDGVRGGWCSQAPCQPPV